MALLINNAGYWGESSAFMTPDVAKARREMDVNYVGLSKQDLEKPQAAVAEDRSWPHNRDIQSLMCVVVAMFFTLILGPAVGFGRRGEHVLGDWVTVGAP